MNDFFTRLARRTLDANDTAESTEQFDLIQELEVESDTTAIIDRGRDFGNAPQGLPQVAPTSSGEADRAGQRATTDARAVNQRSDAAARPASLRAPSADEHGDDQPAVAAVSARHQAELSSASKPPVEPPSVDVEARGEADPVVTRTREVHESTLVSVTSVGAPEPVAARPMTPEASTRGTGEAARTVESSESAIVNIHIGRLDVRAPADTARRTAKRKRAPAAATKPLDLSDYLKGAR